MTQGLYRLLLAPVVALTALAALPAPAAEAFSFALIGDLPYSHFERQLMPALMAEIDASDVAFVIHDGDIKDGSSRCSDELFADRLGLFDASRHPFIFVPGDNEWTDCHRSSGGGFDPVERLNRLRTIFLATEESLGRQRIPLERQSRDPAFRDYRENARWIRGPVLFVTLNVPGSGNNVGRGTQPPQEYMLRSRANAAWLASSFALAHTLPARGIVLVIQANPDLEGFSEGRPSRGYAEFVAQLLRETREFPGEVLLVHGDTHAHRIDQPLRDPATGTQVETFTRLETYGSPFLGWVRVEVAGEADTPLFRFRSYPFRPGQ